MQWVQDPSQSNVHNLNNVKHEATRHFRNKKKAYLKAKIEEIEINRKIKNIGDFYRGINDFKKGYQVAGTCECSNEPSGSIKCREFLD